MEVGDYDHASEALLQAKELAPEEVVFPIENLISLELYRDRPQDALSWFEHLDETERTVGQALNLGNAYFGLGEFDRAVDLYGEAIRLMPDEPMGYASRGDALTKLGHRTEAQTDYLQAAGLIQDQILRSPSDPQLRSREVMYLAKASLCDEALSKVKELRGSVPETPGYLLRFAQVHALCGPESWALDFLAQSIQAGAPRGLVCQEPELSSLCAQLSEGASVTQ